MALLDSKLGEMIFNAGNALSDACLNAAEKLEDWDTDATADKIMEVAPKVAKAAVAAKKAKDSGIDIKDLDLEEAAKKIGDIILDEKIPGAGK